MGEPWTWTIAPGAETAARSLVGREQEWFPPHAPQKQNMVRALFIERGVFCKHFKSRADQAASEWRALLHLRAAGVPVPAPVCWSNAPGGGAVLALELLPASKTLKEAYDRRLLPALAALLRSVARAGFLHLDLHVGNVLVENDRLTLIDVHRGRIGLVSPRDEERALGQFAYSLSRVASLPETVRFVRLYRGQADRAFARRVALHADAFRRRHLASRTRRCLKESTGFTMAKEPDGFYALRRPATAAEVRALLSRHDAMCAAGQALKSLEARRVTRQDDHYIKEWSTSGPFRALRSWIRGTPARAAWIAAQGLAVRGIPAAAAVALFEGRRRSAVVSRALPGKPLDRFCREDLAALRDRRPFLEALAAFVRHLHARDAHHRDLKANNILADGPTRFALLDLEDVEFRRVRRSDAIRALAQLNAALPALTRADRWRMLRRYAANSRILGDLRKAAAEIMRVTIARRHNWPAR